MNGFADSTYTFENLAENSMLTDSVLWTAQKKWTVKVEGLSHCVTSGPALARAIANKPLHIPQGRTLQLQMKFKFCGKIKSERKDAALMQFGLTDQLSAGYAQCCVGDSWDYVCSSGAIKIGNLRVPLTNLYRSGAESSDWLLLSVLITRSGDSIIVRNTLNNTRTGTTVEGQDEKLPSSVLKVGTPAYLYIRSGWSMENILDPGGIEIESAKETLLPPALG